MAATFRSVNLSQTPSPDAKRGGAKLTSPTTPRPSTAPHSLPPPPAPQKAMDDATTPTRATFGTSAMVHQKPLPSSPFPEGVQVPEDAAENKAPTRENSHHSKRSRESAEMDVDESEDKEAAGGDDDAGSDGEDSVNADGSRSNKKKKSQRFYCTDYPPCNLSFTRSEHLARHIR